MTAPYYQDDLVTLYCGDCREITEWLTADVLVFDPPYGRNWRQGRLTASKSDAHAGIANDADTSVRDAVLAAWGKRRALVFGDLMLTPPSGTQQVLIYRKPPDAGARGATGGRRRDIEAVYMMGGWPSGIGGKTSILTTGARSQGNPHSAAGRYGHPHAKPVDLMAELIQLWSEGAVADPTCGAGSTLVAAKMLGRRAVGVELAEEYCERAAKRLAVPDLFGAAS